MKSALHKVSFFVLLVTICGQTANALTITCSTNAEQPLIFNIADNITAGPLLTDYQLKFDRPSNRFILGDKANPVKAKFELSGHPMKYQLVLNNESSSSCQTDQPEVLFAMAASPEIQKALAPWNKWVKSKPAVCGLAVEAKAFIQPGAKKVAVVFHGFSQNPLRVHDIVLTFLDAGYNVLVPRLSGHFNVNLRDLDNVNYMDWVKDGDTSLNIALGLAQAMKVAPARVTLAGFSLGGLIASRLAFENEKYIDRMVLIAPVWRMVERSVIGQIIGWVFQTNFNDHYTAPESCGPDGGFVSTYGGYEVERLFGYFERTDGGNLDELRNHSIKSVFERIAVPHIMFTSTSDGVIDMVHVGTLCKRNPDYCTNYSIPGETHTELLDNMDKNVTDTSTMRQLIHDFITAPPVPAN